MSKPILTVKEHRWKCVDCRAGRIVADYLTCRVLAGRHARDHPGHRVGLYRTELIDTFSVQDSPQDSLPLGVADEPPF